MPHMPRPPLLCFLLRPFGRPFSAPARLSRRARPYSRDFRPAGPSSEETRSTSPHRVRESAMATITASLFAALDGVVDPMVGNWHFPYFNEEMGEAMCGT